MAERIIAELSERFDAQLDRISSRLDENQAKLSELVAAVASIESVLMALHGQTTDELLKVLHELSDHLAKK